MISRLKNRLGATVGLLQLSLHSIFIEAIFIKKIYSLYKYQFISKVININLAGVNKKEKKEITLVV